jgi:hypothetical protein
MPAVVTPLLCKKALSWPADMPRTSSWLRGASGSTLAQQDAKCRHQAVGLFILTGNSLSSPVVQIRCRHAGHQGQAQGPGAQRSSPQQPVADVLHLLRAAAVSHARVPAQGY